ncbi:MAG: bifunctional diaminohydroxyphosphoribosylaminopyrimidine deaminase/5-amino-6-(5-phosphoribosylamino)uracil reductase RibD [Planctomycetota bacterium]
MTVAAATVRPDFMRIAARLAWRGTGGTAPNPRVGCVIVNDEDEIVGWGYHRRCGEAHAEVHALRRAGQAAQGATAYVTLEPCNHTGRTGPCSQALIDAGIRRVVIARTDPNPEATGGMELLRASGIQVDIDQSCHLAMHVAAPFAHRVQTGLPWVIAKWAQTIDGRIATRTGESQWISNAGSRRLTHRWRGQVDAILTGIGTVQADDPLLTARDVRTRRTAARIVVDPNLDVALDSQLVRTAHTTPTILACHAACAATHAESVNALRSAGVTVIPVDGTGSELDVRALLRTLHADHDVCDVLVDGGAGLLGRLFAQGCVNEARVFIAPKLLGDERALTAVRGLDHTSLTNATTMHLHRLQRRGDDVIATYGVGLSGSPTP